MSYLLVGLGGFFGAISRFSIHRLVGAYWVGPFPLGTWIINIIGSLGLGLLLPWLSTQSHGPKLHLLLGVGFLGAFTTFSTFSWETWSLMREGQMGVASLYVLSSVAIGLLGVMIGSTLSRAF